MGKPRKRKHNYRQEDLKSCAEARIYIGLISRFDGNSPFLREGSIICYSFFAGKKFIHCKTYPVSTDPKAMGQRIPEAIDVIAKIAASDLQEIGSRVPDSHMYEIWNGYIYHPETGTIVPWKSKTKLPCDGVANCDFLPASEFNLLKEKLNMILIQNAN